MFPVFMSNIYFFYINFIEILYRFNSKFSPTAENEHASDPFALIYRSCKAVFVNLGVINWQHKNDSSLFFNFRKFIAKHNDLPRWATPAEEITKFDFGHRHFIDVALLTLEIITCILNILIKIKFIFYTYGILFPTCDLMFYSYENFLCNESYIKNMTSSLFELLRVYKKYETFLIRYI